MTIVKMISKTDFKKEPTILNVHVREINTNEQTTVYFGKIDGKGKELAFKTNHFTPLFPFNGVD